MAMKARMKGGQRNKITSLQVMVKAAEGNTGQMNPQWVEWLMGYPIGWTDCEDSETP
jgi:DNA (cytosine-5)-methyltransferase 1